MSKANFMPSTFKWTGLHPFFYHPFISAFTPDLSGKTVVDCGCGRGIFGYLTCTTRDLSGAKLIGIDLNDESLAFCRKHKIYDKLIRHRLPRLPFGDKSVDFLICSEVIEHLSRKEGFKLLSEISRVCRGRAVVTTPNTFYHNPPGTPEDRHRSHWLAADFSRAGYKVHGLGFRLSPSGPLASLIQSLYYFFTPVSYVLPSFGAYLFCVKDFS